MARDECDECGEGDRSEPLYVGWAVSTIEERPNGVWIAGITRTMVEYAHDWVCFGEERFGWGMTPVEAAFGGFRAWFMDDREYARQIRNILKMFHARGTVSL